MSISLRELLDFANNECIHITEVPGWEESGFYSSDFMDLIGSPYGTVSQGACHWIYLGNYSFEEQDILVSRDIYRRRIWLALNQKQLDSITPDTTWEELEFQVFKVV